jgi:hypothetical protein
MATTAIALPCKILEFCTCALGGWYVTTLRFRNCLIYQPPPNAHVRNLRIVLSSAMAMGAVKNIIGFDLFFKVTEVKFRIFYRGGTICPYFQDLHISGLREPVCKYLRQIRPPICHYGVLLKNKRGTLIKLVFLT